MDEKVREEPTFAVCEKCGKAFLLPTQYSDMEWLRQFTFHLSDCAGVRRKNDNRH